MNENDYNSYRGIVGYLLYLAVKTIPDIAVAANTLGSFVSKSERCHLVATKRELRYLKGTKNFALVSKPGDDDRLSVYADSNWGGAESSSRKIRAEIIMRYWKAPIYI